MGIKKLFKIKPPEDDTPDRNREILNEMGISTKNPKKKKREKFAAYGKFAKDKAQDKFYAPEGYENYARPQEEDDLNKSELDNESPGNQDQEKKSSSDPYAVSSSASDPYAIQRGNGPGSDPYSNVQTHNLQKSSYMDNSYSSSGLSTGNPYQAPSGYSSAYAGLGAAGNYDEPQRQNSSTPNPYGNGNIAGNPYGNNDLPGLSYASKSSLDKSQSPQNPYASMDNEHAQYGNGSSSLSKNTANPYANLNTDTYSNQLNTSMPSPYGGRTAEQNARGAYNGGQATAPPNSRLRVSRRANQYNNDLNRVKSSADTLDLNKSSLDREDLNQEPRTGEFDFEEVGPSHGNNTVGVDELDFNAPLNDADDHDDLNSTIKDQQQLYQEAPQWQLEEEGLHQSEYSQNDRGFKTFEELQSEEEARQQQEEDEAVDEIKQQIRFTKQSSVASTRNTLRMAQEAEMSGMNSIGLLGHQSEKLNDIERNLDLMKVQNKIADDKVAELKKLNRNILAVHVSNPFNSKRRQREREEKIKNRKMEEKLMQEHTNRELSSSTQRIEGALNGNNDINTVREKYQRQQILDRSKQFQFENDEEDDMMEVEIDRNLDQIQQISGRLKKLAVATGEELDSQQRRVRNIEDSTDDLDIRIHLNTTKLSGIR